MALVKAPFSWPKISDSISVGEIAPQLKAMKGLLRRRDSEWIVLATTSLPDPDLADDEHIGVGVGHHLDLFEQALHGRRLADKVAESSHLLQLTTKLQDLLLHHLLVFDGLEDHLQARQVDGLGDVVLGSDLERLDRGVDRGVPGQDDHGDVGKLLLDAMKEIESAAVGELEVDDGHIGNQPGDGVPARFDRIGKLRLVAPFLEDIGHSGAGRAIIIDDEDSFHSSPSGSEIPMEIRPASSVPVSSPP